MTTVHSAAADLPGTALTSVPEVLRLRGRTQPNDLAFAFLDSGEEIGDTLTYRQLDEAAAGRAALLDTAHRDNGVVLLYRPGLEFVSALLGCMYARVPGAPVQVPTRERGLERMRRIADDVGTRVVLTESAIRDELLARFGGSPWLEGLTLLATDTAPPSRTWQGPDPRPEDIALLQYTSGSTGDPKGVMVTHANFHHNALETDALWPIRPEGGFVSWLPHFHDMGMLFGVIVPLWAGRPSYLMAPEAFIRRPGRWLEAVDRFRASHSAAPSFAYELCVQDAERNGSAPGLDLSSWRIAANGAEPVRWSVVREFTETFASAGFRPEAMCPGYGMAENTLKATGSRPDRAPAVLWVDAEALREDRVERLAEHAPGALPLVGCGVPVLDSRVRVVDPVSLRPAEDGRVGEIWIGGPCVAAGYHRKPQESGVVFQALVAGDEKDGPYLRSGDLGFACEGELYITGRLKDVIIRKGRNFYPQDIELSVENTDDGLHPNCCAAFSVDDGTSERLVVVAEADGRVLRSTDSTALAERFREAVHEGQRLHVDDVVIVRRGSLPKTSSGKVQRRACRQLYLDGSLSLAAPAGGTA